DDARACAAPKASSSNTRWPDLRKCQAVHAPNTPAPMTMESQVAALLTFRSSPWTWLAAPAASAVARTPRLENLRMPTGLRFLRDRAHRAIALAERFLAFGPQVARQHA